MRLIDADKYPYPGDLIHEPTVDAVMVTRCRYCKWSKASQDIANLLFCYRLGTGYITTADDFCSHAKPIEASWKYWAGELPKCPKCGYEYTDYLECSNYCGNCGAKMKGGTP